MTLSMWGCIDLRDGHDGEELEGWGVVLVEAELRRFK